VLTGLSVRVSGCNIGRREALVLSKALVMLGRTPLNSEADCSSVSKRSRTIAIASSQGRSEGGIRGRKASIVTPGSEAKWKA